MPHGHKIYQMAIQYTNFAKLQDPRKFIQMGIFGLKVYHLATRCRNLSKMQSNKFVGLSWGFISFHSAFPLISAWLAADSMARPIQN
jgi:hypothetical protein